MEEWEDKSLFSLVQTVFPSVETATEPVLEEDSIDKIHAISRKNNFLDDKVTFFKEYTLILHENSRIWFYQ